MFLKNSKFYFDFFKPILILNNIEDFFTYISKIFNLTLIFFNFFKFYYINISKILLIFYNFIKLYLFSFNKFNFQKIII
jgi:hypothetical protein